MDMHIAVLSCSRSQLNYFSSLSKQLQQDNFAKIKLLNYKKIPTSFINFLHLWHSPSITPNIQQDILSQVVFYLKRKQNTALGQRKSKLYWPIIASIQHRLGFYLFLHYQDLFKQQKYSHLIVWNGKKFHQAIACIAAKHCNIKCLYAETGPLPGYMQISRFGVDADSHLPKQGDFYKPYCSNIQPSQISKSKTLSKNKTITAFVPFQVVEDSNIYCHSSWIANMRELCKQLKYCVEKCPQLRLLIKEHPECPEQYHDLKHQHPRMVFQPSDQSVAYLLQKSDFVITIKSTVGMEALLEGKPLITLGEAIYNVEDIVLHAANNEQLLAAIEAVITGWQPDSKVLDGYINYLKKDYAIIGDMDNPIPEQLALMSQKIQQITIPSV